MWPLKFIKGGTNPLFENAPMQPVLSLSTYALLFVLAFGIAAAGTPLVMLLARRLGAVDTGGYRKLQSRPMPLWGGLTFALPVLTSIGLTTVLADLVFTYWKPILHFFPHHFSDILDCASYTRAIQEQMLVLFLGGVGILALGIIDDLRGMRARYKLLGQVAVACFVAASGTQVIQVIQIPFLGPVEVTETLSALIVVFWIVGLINAMNLIDGIDGLACGIGLIAVVTLIIPLLERHTPIPLVFFCLMAGALLAFLFYNFHPARIFMGDTGSMFLGYFLATTSLTVSYKTEAATVVFAPILALGVPIFETLISMIRRYIRGVPIFASDSHHTHHRLLRKGFSQASVALMLYGVALLLSAASLVSFYLPVDSPLGFLPFLLAGGALVWIIWMADYFRTISIRNTLRRRQRNSLLDALARYARLSLNNSVQQKDRDYVLDVCRRELGLRFLECWIENKQCLYACSPAERQAKQPAREAAIPEEAERIHIQTYAGNILLIHFAFSHIPDIQEKRDILSCLARVFENVKVFSEGDRDEDSAQNA